MLLWTFQVSWEEHRHLRSQQLHRGYRRVLQNRYYFWLEILDEGMNTVSENPRGFWHGLINVSILSHHLNPLLFRTYGRPFIINFIPLCNSTSSWAQTPAMSHIFWLGKAYLHCLNILEWPIWNPSKTPSA